MKLFRQFQKPKKKKTASKIEKKDQKPRLIKPFLRPETSRLLICLLISAVTALLISPRLTVQTYDYTSGDIAPQTIRAPQDFSVEDIDSTSKRRQDAAMAVLSVYDFNARAEEKLENRIVSAFSAMRGRMDIVKRAEGEAARQERQQFENILKTKVSRSDFDVLISREFKKQIEEYLLELVLPYGRREIVPSKEQLFKERGRGIVLRDIYSNQEVIVDDFSPFIDLQEARIMMKRDARRILRNVRIDVRRTIVNLALDLIDPTLGFNQIETKTRREAARREVSPLYYNMKKGEIIIREGARITDATLVKLRALSSLKQQKNIFWSISGYFFLIFITLAVLYRFAAKSLAAGAPAKIKHIDLLFIATTFILTFVLIKFSAAGAKILGKDFTALSMDVYFYAIPFSFAAMVISIVHTPRLAALCSIIIALFSGYVLEGRVQFFIYSFLSSIVAAQEVAHCRERKTVIRAGLIVGGINALLIFCFAIISGELLQMSTAAQAACGVLSGILAAVLATGFVPITEMIFNYTTDVKLLELADLNQPLLRRLLITAPGTYHHSILVGILAEAAAESINANPLLARVSSYYHDIGKIKKPLYFVENQKAGENKHDKLLPSMSSLIITSHLKDGIELAKKSRLGQPIMDIISQHHGTSIINYFYQKAKEAGEHSREPVSDKDFRYPGPKPQTKEAGIVMLADAVQATSKTLAEPTPARIQNMVQRIINSIFVDGQLDECELTLKDLHLIAGSFNRILNGIFHSRIDYPERPEKEGNGKDTDKKPAKADTDRPPRPPQDGERDLGTRIGISKSRNKHTAA